MTFQLGVSARIARLYNGHRSIYATVTIGRRRFWLQRWDTDRCPENRFRSGPMGWTWGIGRA